MKHLRIESLIIATALLGIGLLFRAAVGDFINKDRVVTVKGLAETEVKADKVIWPIVYKELGASPSQMYDNIKQKNADIVRFLTQNGIRASEISINPPTVDDRKANAYSDFKGEERYIASSAIIVTSANVDTVRKLMQRQTELLKHGIAVEAVEYGSNSLNYLYTGLNHIKPQMIEEATKNARSAAEKFAKDSDSRLGKIKTASQGQFSIEDRDANTAHIKKVRVVTTVEYFLED